MGAEGRTLQDPEIRLVEDAGEVTLLIDDNQAMQQWEKELMEASADILCGYGSTFLEVGLGLGISAIRIAANPNTRRHIVVEKYAQVIELFRARHPDIPGTLEIAQADFFEYVSGLAPSSIDGIFFDPWLPPELARDENLWRKVMPIIIRALKPGGAFIPFFTTRPELKWPFYHFFGRVIVVKRAFVAYATTQYTHGTSGDAYIQCFLRDPGG